MPARVLDAVAGLVGELAEIHLPRVASRCPSMKMLAPEQNMRSLRAGDDHGAHFGMLEADALQRVVQLDVDAEVVGIELELVAGPDAAVLVDVHRERRDRASKVSRQCR